MALCRGPGGRGPPCAAGAPAVAATHRPFYLVNVDTGFVLEIHNGLTAAGTHLEVGRRRPTQAQHQLWQIDGTGLIRSLVSNFVIQCKGVGERVTVGPHSNAPHQSWLFDHNRIICRIFPGECLQVRRVQLNRDGADVILHRYDNKPWQHWRIDYT